MGFLLEFINQPRGAKVGDQLKSILTNNQQHGFDEFSFLVAYVKKSGVVQLAPALQQFKNSGRNITIRGVVGIDDNTSIQGLQYLLPLCDELWVCHNESPSTTFHPKVYIFEKRGANALVFIGSSNLTTGGLYTNYEMNVRLEFDLTDVTQRSEFDSVKQMFTMYSTQSGFSKVLDSAYLQRLYTAGYLFDEKLRKRRALADEKEGRGKGGGGRGEFASERFSAPSTPVSRVSPIHISYDRREVGFSSYCKFIHWCKSSRSPAGREIAARANGKNNLSGHVHSCFYGLRQYFGAHPSEIRRLASEDPDSYRVFADQTMQTQLRTFVRNNATDEDDFLLGTWKTYLPTQLGGRASKQGGAIGSLNKMAPLMAKYLSKL